MNLQRQTKENNILITAIGFLSALFLPFYLISNNTNEKLDMLCNNKINVKKIISVETNSIKPIMLLGGEEIELLPILDFSKMDLLKPKNLNKINYNVRTKEGTDLGVGFVNEEGKLFLGGEEREIEYRRHGVPIRIDNNRVSTGNNEQIEVSFRRDGTISITEDKVLKAKKDKFEEQFVRFYIGSVILKKNQPFLNRFIRDEGIYNKIMKYPFDFKASEIMELKRTEENGEEKLYYAIIKPIGNQSKNLELYIRLAENERYTQYNPFSTLITDIKILEINKDKAEKYKNDILKIVQNLFRMKDIFNIEVLLNEEKVKIEKKEELIKRILNTGDIEVGDVAKQYDYVNNMEIYRVPVKDLDTYEIIKIVFQVKTSQREDRGKKITTRAIENMYIEGK